MSTFQCSGCHKTHQYGLYAVAQLSQGHALTFTGCECGKGTTLTPATYRKAQEKMREARRTEKAIMASVQAARSGRHVRAITTKRHAKRLHALLSEYEDGSRDGERWNFGPGSVEVVT